MDTGQKILISIIGILVGFVVSQTFNIIKYVRRPRFKVSNLGDGVIGGYSGGELGEPAEITLGFYLVNTGWNPAVNTRVFIADIQSKLERDAPWEDGYFSFSELESPIDIIPGGQSVRIVFAEIRSDEKFLKIPFLNKGNDELDFYVESDTRGKQFFSVEFYIICDDTNSFAKFNIEFSPGDDQLAPNVYG